MIELKKKKAYKPGKHEDEFVLEPEALRGEQYLAEEIRMRTLKNKVSGTGYREGTIWTRPGLGLDEDISIRQYARNFTPKLITNHGSRYYVGKNIEEAIKVYDSKKDALLDLVIDPNPEVMAALKLLVIEKLSQDSDHGSIEIDEDTSRYLAGEDEVESDQDNHIPVALVQDDLGE